MRNFSRTKSSILVASIFALGATVVTGCDNSSETRQLIVSRKQQPLYE